MKINYYPDSRSYSLISCRPFDLMKMLSNCCCSQKQKEAGPHTVTIFVGIFFFVNFVLGVGFLGIPFAFFHGGIIAGVGSLIVVVFLAWNTALFEIETMARAQAVCDLKDGLYDTANSLGKPDFKVKDTRKFEMTELCDIFFGKWAKIIYVSILLIHVILTLVTYTTVASSAWAVNLPVHYTSLRQCNDRDFLHQYFPSDPACGNTYRVCMAIFAALVIPLSLLDLKEQAVIQFLLGILRFIMLTLITLYCVYHILSGDHLSIQDIPNIGENNITEISENFNMSTATYQEAIFNFDFSGWVIGIPVVFYAIMLHQGIPSLVHPVKEKLWLKESFIVLFSIIGSFYLVVSFVGALWFRNIVNETFSLNWVPYTTNLFPLYIRIFSYFVILFPSIDVCSVYPLVVHAVVNSVYFVIFSKDTSQEKGPKSKIIQLALKLVMTIIPILIGLFVTNLVYIVKFAGLVGFFIGLFFPIALQLRSQWVCMRKFAFISNKESVPLKKLGKTSYEDDATTDTDKEPMNDEDRNEGDNHPLIAADNTDPISCRKLVNFFVSTSNSGLYHTRYSTVFSYPLSVMFLSALSVVIVILTIISLFIHPTNIE